ncbi:hypothetical protein V8G54_014233 [Vigna mungo]|uniref:UDP-galactose/UDP-glucose transporter 3 n=1 Tax=Vigna mungo TaxID=3915 RepID=A0AAQ3NIZ8_VIGMU
MEGILVYKTWNRKNVKQKLQNIHNKKLTKRPNRVDRHLEESTAKKVKTRHALARPMGAIAWRTLHTSKLLLSLSPFLLLFHYLIHSSPRVASLNGVSFIQYSIIVKEPNRADLMEAHGGGLRRILLLAFCVAGIWSAYIYQGVLQENVSTKRFGPNGERFEHLAFLNLAQSVIWSSGNSGGAPWWSYWSAGITNTIGPAMGIEALKYISYPAQVLAKSSKMIPVMLMGTLVYGIRYSLPEYICTFLVAGGVSTFALLKTSSKTISKLAHPNAPLGYGLCFLNLAFDGFTNATQDSIKGRYPKTSAWGIMLGMNLWGTIYNLIYMFGWPHASGFEAVRFCKQYPEAAWDIFLYCCCGAVGQNFIFLTISRFGSLANTTITTTRKFVSIVISSVLSGNPLSTKQWGIVLSDLSQVGEVAEIAEEKKSHVKPSAFLKSTLILS